MVVMPYGLLDVLGTLTKLPNIARLAELDAYDDTEIDGPWLSGLIAEAASLVSAMRSRRAKVIVPDYLQEQCNEDVVVEFGLEKFIDWISELSRLAQKAHSLQVPLVACGD